ncbi:MAG: rRNA pseudouridine synthase [Prevotellaceae bacterium]|nr:rRNA pseudouridine synthase [Prevotellaceae bacterium]
MKKQSTGVRRKALSVKREATRVKGEGLRVKGERSGMKREGPNTKRFTSHSTDKPRTEGSRFKDSKFKRARTEDSKPVRKRFSDDSLPVTRHSSRPEKPARAPRRFDDPKTKLQGTRFKDSKFETRNLKFKKSRTEDIKPTKRRFSDDSSPVTRHSSWPEKPTRSPRRFDKPRTKVQGEKVQGTRFKDSKFETRNSKFKKSRTEDIKPSKRRSLEDSASCFTPHASHSAKPIKKQSDDGIRLNKFIANSGICSRREADEYIVAGLVSVNGNIVTELGVKVQPNDDVRFNNERLKGEQKVYIVMNKPKDFVTTMSDLHAEKTVMDLIGEKCPSRVFPVGRLDKATTGVLVFTNDGELTEQLTHPSYNKKKIYHIFLDKNLKQFDLQQLLDGVELEDGVIQADSLSYVDGDNAQVGLEIHSGRNRVVRRMFEALGYKVKKLDRVYFAGLTKKNLKRGQWRFLTDTEVNMLRMGAYE